ncbi:kinase domain-containing protein [Pochonia chlamydosporia 170]|uniref:Kinase domain-containing protein n=1 Tax=Pochonia chlamydosporia 170 TaxID=1380566 RepID=A0A179EY72_METCM|nr:kinase domain-containing protein [Pochonia chlamydosporia 170]OAQ58145.1 kinase domain-containing protein [Pochonia chlamydosporia 170]
MFSHDPRTPPYDIRGWDTGDDHFDINIRVNGFRFNVTVSQENFVNSPQALRVFHEIFDKLAAGEDYDPDVWQYSEDIADVFVSHFQQLAPAAAHTGKLTLADLAVRGSFECEYRVVDETPVAGTVTTYSPESASCQEWNIRLLQSSFPVFYPGEIEIPFADGGSIYDIVPQKVRVRGNEYFYKSCWSPYDAINEVKKYSKIAASDIYGQLCISRLFGIVANTDGQTKGLLYDLIEVRGAGTLTYMISFDTPIALRKKWASQIQQTVAGLHSLGIVWGDVKSDNVLIDNGNNAIVIDLEGGTTRGWIDHDVSGSIEGDLQGLEKLVDFIFNDESPLRKGRLSDFDCSDESN